MTTIRQFRLDDLLKFNNINLDVLTETYNMHFYMSYMSQWPEAFTGEPLFLDQPLRSNSAQFNRSEPRPIVQSQRPPTAA